MPGITQKLKTFLPAFPRRRYNIFSGTNSWREWLDVGKAWAKRERADLQEQIRTYEDHFAATIGVSEAISFGAGRMGLYAILKALDIGYGDEIILPAYTCVVVPNALLYRGVHPVYVDIDPQTFNIDLNKVESAITPRTRAIYAQHTFGVPCDISGLQDIAKRYGLPIIEDCAHALGAIFNNRPIGSLTEVSYFSTDHSKVIGTYLGGMAATNNSVLAEKIRAIQETSEFLPKRMHQRLLLSFLLEHICYASKVLWLGRTIMTTLIYLKLPFFYRDELLTSLPSDYPYPCRLSAQQAMIGSSQLRLLNSNLEHRRRLAGWLESQVGWYGMSDNELQKCTWLRYSFLVRDREAFERRFKKCFDLGIWFISIAQGRNHDFESIDYRTGSCPVAESVGRHIVNFPTHPRIPLEVLMREFKKHKKWLKSQILWPEEIVREIN